MEKNNRMVIILMGIIIVILVVACVLFATGKITFTSKTIDAENSSLNALDNKKVDGTEYGDDSIKLDDIETDLENLGSATVNSINIISGSDDLSDFIVTLKLNGEVSVLTVSNKDGNNITNNLELKNIKEMIKFPVAGLSTEQMVYFLTFTGDVYSYVVGESINNNFTPQKVENVSKVKKLFVYHYPAAKKNAGGSWAMFALDSDDKLVKLNSDSA